MDWDLFKNSPDGFFNTPSVYSIYVTGLNVRHMIKQGGLNHYIDLANKRSKMLYDFIDASNGFYVCRVQPEYRSKINACFRII